MEAKQKQKKQSKYEIIVEAVNAVFSEYSGKMSLRQIYYRLVSKHIIPNNINSYKGLSRHLVKARENGRIDWRRIEDRNRSTSGWDFSQTEAPDIEETIKGRLESAISRGSIAIKAWKNQPEAVEVWIEKDALSRLAGQVASKYNVTVCPSKGYSSFTYLMEAVRRINNYTAPVTILYFGDYDPSGMDITRDLEARLRRYGATNLKDVERHCLSLEQIIKHDLPPFPAKTSDARYSAFVAETGSADAVELDALEPPILKQYILEAIEEHIDITIWNETITYKKEAEEELNEAIDTLRDAVIEAFPEMNLGEWYR